MILRTEKLLVASDVMTSNPKSLHSGATLREAMAFLLDNGFSAAPIVNIAGRPLGVVRSGPLPKFL
jgi:CBS domain-containing protein